MALLFQRLFWIILGFRMLDCQLFIPTIPEHCLSEDYCEDVPNYPYEYVDGVINELTEQGYIWQNDDVVSFNQTLLSVSTSEQDFIDICPETIRNVAPLAVKDSDGQWRFVLNGRNSPPQLLKMRLCSASVISSACGSYNQIDVEAASGYYSQCEQEYFYLELICLDEFGKPYMKNQKYAVCCSCAVYHDIENEI